MSFIKTIGDWKLSTDPPENSTSKFYAVTLHWKSNDYSKIAENHFRYCYNNWQYYINGTWANFNSSINDVYAYIEIEPLLPYKEKE